MPDHPDDVTIPFSIDFPVPPTRQTGIARQRPMINHPANGWDGNHAIGRQTEQAPARDNKLD